MIEDRSFKGLDTGTSKDSLEPGKYQEWTNMSADVDNVAGPRQGFVRVLQEDFQNNSVVSSGEMTDDIAADAFVSSGVFGKFNRLVPIDEHHLRATFDGKVIASGAANIPSGSFALGSGSLQAINQFSLLTENEPSGTRFSKFSYSSVSGDNFGAYSGFMYFHMDQSGLAYGSGIGNLSPDFSEDGFVSRCCVAGYEWTAESGTISDDQVSRCRIYIKHNIDYTSGDASVGPAVRVRNSYDNRPGSGLLFLIQRSNTDSSKWKPYLLSVVGNYGSVLATGNDQGTYPVNGTELLITVSGTTAECFVSGIKLISTTSIGSYSSASGLPGIGTSIMPFIDGATYLSRVGIYAWTGGPYQTGNTDDAYTSSFYSVAGAGHEYSSSSGTIQDDQYAEMTITRYVPRTVQVAGPDALLGPAVRVTNAGSSSGSCYWLGLKQVGATTYEPRLYKVVNGIQSRINGLLADTFTGTTFVLRLECRGNTLYAYVNDVRNTYAAADATLTSGVPGIAGNYKIQALPTLIGGGSGQISSWAGNNWNGGSLTTEGDTAGLGTLEPSGYAVAISEFVGHGERHYTYVDASGFMYVMLNPLRSL